MTQHKGRYTLEGIRPIRGRRDVWELRISLGPDPGGRKDRNGRPVYRQRSITFHGTKAEARATRQRLVDSYSPKARLETDYTVADLIEHWLMLAKDDLAETTLRNNRQIAAKHIVPHLGAIKLRDLNTVRIDALYAQLHAPAPKGGAGLHARSVRRVHAVLNTALKWGLAWEWIDRNPAAPAHPPRIHGKPTLYTPTIDELRAALEVALADSPTALAFLWTAAATGLRRGEIAGLQWGDILPERLTLSVARNIVDVAGKIAVKLPKSGKARLVAIPLELVAVLAEYKVYVDARAAEANQKAGPWLWSADHGATVIHPEKLTDTWNRVKAAAGIPKECRLHDLRHAYGSNSMADRDGRDVAALADQLGHGDMSTTLRFYLHGLSSGQHSIAARMGELLAGTPASAPAS